MARAKRAKTSARRAPARKAVTKSRTKPARPAAKRPAALNYNNPQEQPKSMFPSADQPAAPPGVNDLVQDRQPARVGGDDVIKTVKREEPKIGRNDPCWCGSGKKFKKCHGA